MACARNLRQLVSFRCQFHRGGHLRFGSSNYHSPYRMGESFVGKQQRNLTTGLVPAGNARARTSHKALLGRVNRHLVNLYGTPTLGNFRDPIKEIFYILLSARTTDALYRRAHRQLFSQFGDLGALVDGDVRTVERCVRGAGLGQKRASQIVQIARRLSVDLAPSPRGALRKLDAHRAYAYLTSLPGLGPKSALCVMMYSLDFDVFPVDINVQRIFERLGVLPAGLKHYRAQAIAPASVPRGLAKTLHIGLVVHGRRICTPLNPRCDECTLVTLCRHGKHRRHQHH